MKPAQPIQPDAIGRICDAVVQCWSPQAWRSVRVVLGVSGGADSVCLLRAMLAIEPAARENLIVAHFDHQMRSDSDADANFTAELAERFQVALHAGRSAQSCDRRSEAMLRNERYQFLESVANQAGARYVAVAQHRDDLIETVLHNGLRGSGPSGVRGIPVFRPLGQDLVLARPLLSVSRIEIRAALAAWGQTFREDPSNQSSRWKRNWLRNELLPLIRTQYPQADDAITRLSQNIDLQQSAIEYYAEQLREEIATTGPGQVTLVIDPSTSLPPAAVCVCMLQRLWNQMGWPQVDMTQTLWIRLVSLLASQSLRTTATPFHLPGQIRVEAETDRLRFRL